MFGRRDIDPEKDVDEETIQSSSESDIALGAYARTGFELKIVESFRIGAGLRVMTSGLEFSDSAGENKVEGVQYFLNISINI